MNKICVIGTGYVGLVTGTCFAEIGNEVVCLDINEERIKNLINGKIPIYELGLEDLVQKNINNNKLSFTTNYTEALKDVEHIFIAVGTPSSVDGEADLQYVKLAVETIANVIDHNFIIINKSTVPIGTGDWVAEIIKNYSKNKLFNFDVVSNPEFLREGSAINDFMNPDRIVLGSESQEASQKVSQLYKLFQCPIIMTDLRTAEMIKYASNSFLATKISFINEIANICEELGANVKQVALGMGYDKRIGHSFLNAGIGWGGSCFPKDVKALKHMAKTHEANPQLLQAVIDINDNQKTRVITKLRNKLGTLNGKTIGVLGLSFKPETDDIRESPSIDICKLLLKENAFIKAYDPKAMQNVLELSLDDFILCDSLYDVAYGADALILATEWDIFKYIDFTKIKKLMKYPLIVDGRNFLDGNMLIEIGFIYIGVGQGIVKEMGA